MTLPGAITADAEVPAVRVRGSLTGGLTVLGLPAADFLAAVFDRRLRFGFPAGTSARAMVAGGIASCRGAGCRALARIVTAVEIVAGESRCLVPLAQLWRVPAMLITVVVAPLADPLRGGIRRVARSTGATAAGCFACDRPLTAGRAGCFTVARFTLSITPAIAAELTAGPGYAPAWGLVPVAPPRSNA